MLDATLHLHLPPHRVDAVQISFALELLLHSTLQNLGLHLHLHLLAHSANWAHACAPGEPGAPAAPAAPGTPTAHPAHPAHPSYLAHPAHQRTRRTQRTQRTQRTHRTWRARPTQRTRLTRRTRRTRRTRGTQRTSAPSTPCAPGAPSAVSNLQSRITVALAFYAISCRGCCLKDIGLACRTCCWIMATPSMVQFKMLLSSGSFVWSWLCSQRSILLRITFCSAWIPSSGTCHLPLWGPVKYESADISKSDHTSIFTSCYVNHFNQYNSAWTYCICV